MKKDICWTISNVNYTIKNVPFEIYDDEEFFDMDISIKITALRDLMAMNEIPHVLDFEDIKDIEF